MQYLYSNLSSQIFPMMSLTSSNLQPHIGMLPVSKGLMSTIFKYYNSDDDIRLQIIDHSGDMSSRFSWNSDVNASELLENLNEVYPRYW